MKPGLQPPGVSIDTKADERGRMGNLSSTAATKSPSRRSPVRERKVKVLLGEWQETLRSTVREMRACSSLNQSCLVSLRSTNLAVLIRIGGLFLLPTRFARLAGILVLGGAIDNSGPGSKVALNEGLNGGRPRSPITVMPRPSSHCTYSRVSVFRY
jgi:hypothetical protein